HDIGVHISYERHHKHSYYLIQNGDLRGFEPDEIETIALLTRYHRRATPKRRHPGFGELPRKRRRAIRTLAAILRLAESLDRSHSQTISTLDLHDRGDDGLLQLRTASDAELELWAASRHAKPFERVLGKALRIEVSETAYVEQPHQTARVSGEAGRRGGQRRIRKNGAGGAVGARAVQLWRPARYDAVFPGADRGISRSADGPPRKAQVLRGRHGPRLERQSGREFPPVSRQSAGRV